LSATEKENNSKPIIFP